MSGVGQTIIQPAYEPLLRSLDFTPAWVFSSERVVVWRKLEDRENCTIDAAWPDGRAVRLHVKRYPARWAACAENEATALTELRRHSIPCASLVASGRLADGRAFVMTEDLVGFVPADKLIAAGESFDRISATTAELAARLHSAGFHHRDLYLCHFMVRPGDDKPEVRLIDAARVRRLPPWPLRNRWIVKDLAQFWYSATQLAITDAQRELWLEGYVRFAGSVSARIPRSAVIAKARRIAAHDVNLNRRQPTRHFSIPS